MQRFKYNYWLYIKWWIHWLAIRTRPKYFKRIKEMWQKNKRTNFKNHPDITIKMEAFQPLFAKIFASFFIFIQAMLAFLHFHPCFPDVLCITKSVLFFCSSKDLLNLFSSDRFLCFHGHDEYLLPSPWNLPIQDGSLPLYNLYFLYILITADICCIRNRSFCILYIHPSLLYDMLISDFPDKYNNHSKRLISGWI